MIVKRKSDGAIFDTTVTIPLPPGEYEQVSQNAPCGTNPCGPAPIVQGPTVVQGRPICEPEAPAPMIVNIAVCALPRLFVACDESILYKELFGDWTRCPGSSTDSWEELDLLTCPTVYPLKIDPDTYNLYHCDSCGNFRVSKYDSKTGYGVWMNSQPPCVPLKDVFYDPKTDHIVFHKNLCEGDARVLIDNPFCTEQG